MSYIDAIKQFSPLTLDDIIKVSKDYVPNEYKRCPWSISGMDHGISQLSTEAQLCCYMAAYGEMHKSKFCRILKDFPFSDIDDNYEIIDWGAGQGLGSICLLDAMRNHQLEDNLQKVTLVEPSAVALERAQQNLLQAVEEHVLVDTLNFCLPANLPSITDALTGIHIEEPICIHIFSNILDITTIDLKKLAFIVSSSGYRHYFLCVGPMNFGNYRIDAFERYFQIEQSEIFSNFRTAQYAQLSNGRWYGCVTKGFKIVREEGKPFLLPLAYYPSKQFHAAFRLDAIEEFEFNSKMTSQWSLDTCFEVLAPFDIGASVYDDIDPILAVMSNIITRGLPTKCSPFLENELNKVYGISQETDQYGTLKYRIKEYENVQKNYDILRKVPIAVARMEKVIIEAVLTGHISIAQKEWKVLVKENDVPCAALAFVELEMMYNHLTALTKKYNSFSFPKVQLEIISPKYSQSKLHIGYKTYIRPNQVNHEQQFDMVIDFAIDDNIDAVNVQFSEFKAKNNCYFNVRSSVFIYSSRDIYTTDAIIYNPITAINPNESHTEKENTAHLVYFLRLLFRKKEFRPGQLPILNRALQKKGVIGLLPTGGGKSLTYQLASMLQPGVTVIIDPLKSLMQDQYDGLLANGIDCCTYINSELTSQQRQDNEKSMELSKVIYTFMSPERLCIYEFRERLQNMSDVHVYFSYGVIDEVHCVSEWGQDFRFSYLHLGRNLYSFLHGKDEHISLFGLTATASFDVLSDVERELTGNGAFTIDPEAIVRYENSNRLELQYKIEKVDIQYKEDMGYWPHGPVANYPHPIDVGDIRGSRDAKADFIADYIKKIPKYIRELETDKSLKYISERFNEREGLENVDENSFKVSMPDDFYKHQDRYDQAGIIFCPHVKTTGVSVSTIGDENHIGRYCEVGTFSGSSDDMGLQNNSSMENMRRFRDNQLPIMVATKAFGMGIDKPNVRFTINMNYSSSLESFVQEAGRAGRDRKMALSVILFGYYRLARLKRNCGVQNYPVFEIEGKWFKVDDLKTIISDFKLNVTQDDIEYCDPLSDLVRFKCTTNDLLEIQDAEGSSKSRRKTWYCGDCSKRETCELCHIDRNLRYLWMTPKEMNDYLLQNNIRIPKENIEYQGADYNTVMYFFDNNFKGEREEKLRMNELLSEQELVCFVGNDKKDKPDEHTVVKGFMKVVLDSKPGTEVVSLILYNEKTYSDIAKAIYRMCVIGLIDDFTQDYSTKCFRILSKRKEDGAYYQRLKEFLMRYYSEERSEYEVGKAKMRNGQNEIHKCLGYLTEFIYDKIALKRKRAIDDIRNFCLIGVNDSKDWKEINEDLKDEIFFYFNSKYAREGYCTDNGEPFSLLDDTDRGKKFSFDILMKYMRVIDNDVIGVSGSPKDSIRHLLGAVKLIRRGATDVNPTLDLLNVFCLLTLKVGDNRNMLNELQNSYEEGYIAFRKQTHDINEFFNKMKEFKNKLNENGRNVASDEDLKMLEKIEMLTEFSIHERWLSDFNNLYNQ
jgi:superfamily II DNA helicase RecQ